MFGCYYGVVITDKNGNIIKRLKPEFSSILNIINLRDDLVILGYAERNIDFLSLKTLQIVKSQKI